MSIYDEDNIVSCEDNMPQIMGIFNFGATLTSIPILVLPIYYLYRSWSREDFGILPKLYYSSLTLVFVGNLYEHATGYIGPPCLDTCGSASNLFLAAMMYGTWWDRKHNQLRKKHTKNEWIFKLPSPDSIMMLSIGLALASYAFGSYSLNLETFALTYMFPFINLYVISIMGLLSYQDYVADIGSYIVREKDKVVTSWQLWKASVILGGAVVTFVPLEKYTCSFLEDFSFLGLRGGILYHALWLHLLIPIFLGCVSELAFRLVAGVPNGKEC